MKKTTEERISSVLETFYNLTQLPVIVFNKNWKEKNIIGHNEYSHQLIKRYTNKNLINKFNKKIDSVSIDINGGFSFSVKYVNNDLKIDHYFVIGPYRNEECRKDDLEDTLSFRNSESIYYSFELLKILIIDKTSFSNNIFKRPLNYNIKKAITLIHSKYYEKITIEAICEELNLNKCYFCSLFKKETGLTFSKFLSTFRVEKSKDLLYNKELSLLDIAVSVGFNNQNYYTMVFKNLNGVTPLEYRKTL